MENRASILATHSISALNLIDIIFVDSNDVRNARRDFMDAVNSKPFVVTSAVERYYALAHCVARDIGLNDKISIAEIRSVYAPISQGDQAELEHLERQQRLSSLRQSSDRPTGPE